VLICCERKELLADGWRCLDAREKYCWLVGWKLVWLCWKLDGNIYMFSGYDYVQI